MSDKDDQQEQCSHLYWFLYVTSEIVVFKGTEMMDSQLMGEFECDIKDLEADSWSGTVDKKFLKTLKKDEIKRQDVIYGKYR